MQKVLIAVSISLAAGFAIGAWLMKTDDAAEAPAPVVASSDGDVVERVRELEQKLAAEQSARRLLEERLDTLSARFGPVSPNGSNENDNQRVVVTEQSSTRQNRAETMATRMQRMREQRLRRFVQGGYAEDEARRLMEAESDAQLQSMHDQWEAQRNGESNDWFSGMTNAQDILREQLGDAEYERYLVAQGAPAAIQVASVMERSSGSIAGLQPGDQIVSYNGSRTFSMMDLRRETLQAGPGETVLVEIDRDGVRMQLSMPSGPIGMNGSGAAPNMNWWIN